MGRVKLEIKKIENPTNRQVTYSKRRNGLMKKGYELSVLCDIDLAMIMFSPSGKLTVFSKDDRLEEVVLRYANAPPHERAKRKFENVEFLNKVVQKLIDERPGGSSVPRPGYAELLSQNEDLVRNYNKLLEEKNKVLEEKNFFEKKSRLFGGIIDVNRYTSRFQLERIRVELEQAQMQILERIAEVEGREQMNTYGENALHPTAYDLGALPAREGPSSEVQTVGDDTDSAPGLPFPNAWEGLQQNTASSLTAQLREPADAFAVPSTSYYDQRTASVAYNDHHGLRSDQGAENYSTKVEDSQFHYGGGGSQDQMLPYGGGGSQDQMLPYGGGGSQDQMLPADEKQIESNIAYFASMHQPQHSWCFGPVESSSR